MVGNDLRSCKFTSLPGALAVFDQRDIIIPATSLPADCVNTQFRLDASDNEFLDLVASQILIK